MSAPANGVCIDLYLVGDPLDVDRLNAHFGVSPTVIVCRGSPRVRPSTNVQIGIHNQSTWGFSSASAVQSPEIGDHANWLLSTAARGDRLLRTSPHLRVFLEIRLFGLKSCSCVVPTALLAFATEFHADIGFVSRHIDTALG